MENNTDHTDSESEMVHDLLDVKVEHLQRRYQRLLYQSRNQPEQTNRNKQWNKARSLMLTTGMKLLNPENPELSNPELNNDTPPLNKLPSCEEQLTEIHTNYHAKYVTFTINKQVFPIILFQKVRG